MNLSEPDGLLSASFAEFAAAATPSIRPQGADAARLEVAHRRRLRAVALSVLAAVAIAVPVAAYAAFGRPAHGPPRPPATAAPTVDPSTPPTAEPGPNPEPAEGPCAQKPPTATPPRNVVSVDELCNATLDLPAWQSEVCTRPEVTLVNGRLHLAESVGLSLRAVVQVDVDHDGTVETVAIVACGGETMEEKVVAFRRAPDDGVATMAQVLATVDPIRVITELQGLPDGRLRITVGDFGNFLGTDPTIAQHQQRTYGWNGQRFVQIGGPTTFPPNPRLADLALTAPDLVFSAPAGGIRTATYTLTARNLGPADIQASVTVQLPSFIELVSPPSGCGVQDYPSGGHEVQCLLPVLRAGTSTPLTLTLHAPANAASLTAEFVPTAQILIPETYNTTNRSDGFDDPRPENNRREGLGLTYR
jgi:hypothetical protein